MGAAGYMGSLKWHTPHTACRVHVGECKTTVTEAQMIQLFFQPSV